MHYKLQVEGFGGKTNEDNNLIFSGTLIETFSVII